MPTPKIPTWSTPVAEVERRLRTVEGALRKAQGAGGGVDLVKARALLGTDQVAARMLAKLQSLASTYQRTAVTLDGSQARRAFLELQMAVATARDVDQDGDGRIGYREMSFESLDDTSDALIFRAAEPLETKQGRRAPRIELSLEARREAEATISKVAAHHAATPEGAEALKWSMRERLVDGYDVNSGIVYDAVNYSEKDWRASIPFFGKKHREGKGHLSDAELKARFKVEDLGDFIAEARERVNARLLMDYEREFLHGKGLPA